MSGHDPRSEPHHELNVNDPSHEIHADAQHLVIQTAGDLTIHGDISLTSAVAPSFGQDVVPAFGESHPVPAFGESAPSLMQDRDHGSTSRPARNLSEIEPKGGERAVTMLIDGQEVSAVLVETELRAGCLCPLCGHVIEADSQALEEDGYSPQQTDSAGQCESTWQAESFDSTF